MEHHARAGGTAFAAFDRRYELRRKRVVASMDMAEAVVAAVVLMALVVNLYLMALMALVVNVYSTRSTRKAGKELHIRSACSVCTWCLASQLTCF